MRSRVDGGGYTWGTNRSILERTICTIQAISLRVSTPIDYFSLTLSLSLSQRREKMFLVTRLRSFFFLNYNGRAVSLFYSMLSHHTVVCFICLKTASVHEQCTINKIYDSKRNIAVRCIDFLLSIFFLLAAKFRHVYSPGNEKQFVELLRSSDSEITDSFCRRMEKLTGD